MEIEYQYTREDFIKFNKSYCAYSFRKRLPLVILLTLIIPAFSSNDKSFDLIRYISIAIIILIALVIVVYFIPLIRVSAITNKILNNDKEAFEKRKLTIIDEGLQIESESATSTRLWVSMLSVSSIKGFVYIRLVDKRALVFPDRFFKSQVDKANFLGTIQSRILGSRLTLDPKSIMNYHKPSYYTGLWCLIPVAGAVYGVILAANGISKYRDKWLILIGVGGIVWTILFVWMVSKPLDYAIRNGSVSIAQEQLNKLVTGLEFYKYKNGVYPDSLRQLTVDGTFVWIDDPIQDASPFSDKKSVLFNYQRIGNHYKLFSSGVDGIPGTADDIYPQVSKSDSAKFGLIRK